MPAWFGPSDYFRALLGPLGEVTTAMERHGVPFDVAGARDTLGRIRDDLAVTRARLAEWLGPAGVNYRGPENPPNLRSWQQLQRLLYTEDGCNMRPSPYWKKGSTGYAESGEEVRPGEGALKTDDVALAWLAGEYPEHAAGIGLVRDYRWQTRAENYVETWLGHAVRHRNPGTPDWDWLHPSFGLASDRDERAGARTGRFAVKNPALNQVPSRGDDYGLKALFRAPPGWEWVVVDYTQLEIVVLAHVCAALFGTDGLVRRLEPGQPDMHSATAKFVWGEVLGDQRLRDLDVGRVKAEAALERDLVKAVRYGVNYGKGPRGFGDTLFDRSGRALGEDRARSLLDALFAFDPEIPRYQDWVRETITRDMGLASLMGRWCPLPDAASDRTGTRNRAWRQALNWPMQAGGQEIMAAAMLSLQRDPELAGLQYRMILPCHDEICGLVPEGRGAEAFARVVEVVTTTVRLRARLSAAGGHGDSWGTAKH